MSELDKEEAKKIALEFFHWSIKENQHGYATSFDKFWQETHPETHNGLTIPEWVRVALLDDVLVEVNKNENFEWSTYYLHASPRNDACSFGVYAKGGTSKTQPNSFVSFKNCRLIEDIRWRKNTGEQPLPDCVEVEVFKRNGHVEKLKAGHNSLRWYIEYMADDILFYRIIG